MKHQTIRIMAAAVLLSVPAFPTLAYSDADVSALRNVFATRVDLRSVFNDDWTPKSVKAAGDMTGLIDWAERYGCTEMPELLGGFALASNVESVPVMDGIRTELAPKLRAGASFDFSSLTAGKVLVIDVKSRDTLLANQASASHPIASLSKLMTADIALARGVSLAATGQITQADEVGGARLRVPVGSELSLRDVLDATLIGSANNTANVLARSTGLSKTEFVAEMNRRANELGMKSTRFADPTGIEVTNVSNAGDVARLALQAFGTYEIKRATTTATRTMYVAGEAHTIKNTNGLLTDPNNGLYVLGGKTGYLPEAGWNLAVKMRSASGPELLVIVLGAGSQQSSFNDAAKVARWIWQNYTWI